MSNEAGRAKADLVRRAVALRQDEAFITLSRDGVIETWNAGAERLFGWNAREVLQASIDVILRHADSTEPGLNGLWRRTRASGASSGTHAIRCRDGTSVMVTTTWVGVTEGTTVLGYALMARRASSSAHMPQVHFADVHREDQESRREDSESQEMPAADAAASQEADVSRTRLLRRLVVAQEEERRRLARDLHDGLGQQLTGLRLTLERVARDLQAGSSKPHGVTEALSMLAQIDREVDFVAWELRPAALDQLELTRVLEAFVTEWAHHVRVTAVFRARPDALPRFSPEIETTLYRIAQEALNNVAKHAQARSVNVLLELRDDVLSLAVEDDGIGVSRTVGGETMIGLTTMRERALAVGGTIEVEPTPDGGTTVLASIPTGGQRRTSIPYPQGLMASSASEEATEVTGRGEGLADMRARLEELQRAVGARDEFIATVAHELRNPIAPLTFQVRLALNKTAQLVSQGTPVSAEWIQSQLVGIERRLHRLLETLDRLLDVSRLSTGRIDLQPEPLHLGELVREVVEGFDAELAVARCTIRWSEKGEPTGVWDRVRIEQIARNLLSNAVHYGAGRPIEVSVTGDQDFACLAVRDHGVGIAADQLAKIFERFERGGERRGGGFGIGLWMVRNLCVAMGGTVTVESLVGDGACFTVLLPRRQPREAAPLT